MVGRSGVSVLLNPHAGRGLAEVTASRVAVILRERGVPVAVPAPESVPAMRACAAEAVQRGDAGVVVIGGDGMCHLVIQELAGTPTALGIIPVGTGNDFAAALGLPSDVDTAATAIADALESGQHRTVDLGSCGRQWWASVLCAGFDSAVNDRANRMRWPHGPRRYDLALIAELARLRAVPMELVLDGQTVSLEATLVAVGNTSSYGGGIPICPQADPQDGMLDITVVGKISRRRLIRVTPTLRRGEHLSDPAVSTYRARTITLHSDEEPAVTAYADGEPIQALPVTATCEPGALRVLQSPPRP
ncbi:MAG: YegS/Rv2252/BmrU family lipid kinase [Geodermatophilaceae bacterium]|nr:YegS/Rv2252/BmrU family lipid kinase [Geodermatophilaceae bacterium]